MKNPKSIDLEKISVHPIISKLAEAAGQETIVEFTGYVGPSDVDVVRIYDNFKLNSYKEVSKNAILHVVEETNDGLIKFYVRASADVRFINVSSTKISAQEAMERRRFSGNTLERVCKILGEQIRILDSLTSTPEREQLLRELREARSLLRCGHIGYHFHPD